MNPPRSPCAGSLFECVAEQDYDGLLSVLAAEGIRVLQHRASWAAGAHAASHHHSEMMEDDLYDQESKSSDPFSPQGLRNGSSAAAYGTLMTELTHFLHDTEQQNNAHSHACPARKLELSEDAERLLRESLSLFVDARPPADFVVYQEADQREGTAAAGQQQQQQQPPPQQPQDPPIFDGSVANATPPPVDGGPAGGAGTLMHLATALDQPLVLALCLALGGDARACHTAFRRLLVHEAACNGSLQCLTLLLELGRQFTGTLQHPEETRRIASASLPFLPRRLDRGQCLAALPFLSHAPPPPVHHQHHDPPTNVIPLLHHFRTLVQQVRQGNLTELQAARLVLKQSSIKPLSQRALARACQFHSIARSVIWRGGSLDGHGNTPLHWAAFKNETACVSLLLSYGADPNARAHPSGWTPLHDAAYSNSVESIRLLIRAGAHVDARANSGATPLCFASQEDADKAVQLLLEQGANMTARCAGNGETAQQQSRFSGYTPLHYCSHYNARRAAKVLLSHPTARRALEIADLCDRLPIHVAVARGSAGVLRELLHAGARVETRWAAQQQAEQEQSRGRQASNTRRVPPSPEQPRTPRRRESSGAGNVTPVSSPVLRSMIPSQPVTSTKPWNCLTQQSIDGCRKLISEAESNWSPCRHSLFTPADRQAVRTVLMLGKRLDQEGIFPDMWTEVLSFCGRGWFDPEEQDSMEEVEEHEDMDSQPQPDHLILPSF